jgi:hypothetical protein
MGFDFKRYIRDYCRNPVKANTEALRGDYRERRVSMTRQSLLRLARGIEDRDIFDQFLNYPQTRLSPQARTAADELQKCGRTEAFASVESEIERCFFNFCRDFKIRRHRAATESAGNER